MTKQFVIALVISAFSLPALSNHHEHEPTEGPCMKLKEACQAAGFEKGKHKEKKGLMKDCLKPLMHGETVAGVTVSAEDMAACKENRQKWKEHKKEKGHKHKHGDKKSDDKKSEEKPE